MTNLKNWWQQLKYKFLEWRRKSFYSNMPKKKLIKLKKKQEKAVQHSRYWIFISIFISLLSFYHPAFLFGIPLLIRSMWAYDNEKKRLERIKIYLKKNKK